MSWPRIRSRTGYRSTTSVSSPSSSWARPRRSSTSTQSSRAADRCSSRPVAPISSWRLPIPASAGPRHNARPARNRVRAVSSSPAAAAARPWATCRAKTSESRSSGSTRTTYPAGSVITTSWSMPFCRSARRSRDTQLCTWARTVGGGSAPHTASASRSTGTTSLGYSSSTARTVRSRPAASVVSTPPTWIRSGPRMPKRIPTPALTRSQINNYRYRLACFALSLNPLANSPVREKRQQARARYTHRAELLAPRRSGPGRLPAARRRGNPAQWRAPDSPPPGG
jgi:hypothetical protein